MRLLTRKLIHLNSPAILNAMGLTLSVNKSLLTNSIFFVGLGSNLAKKMTVAYNDTSIYDYNL